MSILCVGDGGTTPLIMVDCFDDFAEGCDWVSTDGGAGGLVALDVDGGGDAGGLCSLDVDGGGDAGGLFFLRLFFHVQ